MSLLDYTLVIEATLHVAPRVLPILLTLFDMIRPDSWIIVTRRKNAHRATPRATLMVTAAATPAMPAIQIAAA